MSEVFYSDELSKDEVEAIAISKYYKRGKCKKTCFASGGHRIGLVPMSRPDDGGLQGISCQEVCIECRKKFSYRCFLPDAKGTLK